MSLIIIKCAAQLFTAGIKLGNMNEQLFTVHKWLNKANGPQKSDRTHKRLQSITD